MGLNDFGKNLSGYRLEQNRADRQAAVQIYESFEGEKEISYECTRDLNDINRLYGGDLVAEIEEMIKKYPERKIKILDIGGGVGLLSDQLRKLFPDKVRVFNTSLSPRRMRNTREKKIQEEKVDIPKELHPDDAITQSIYEMRKFPEFDLILDTFGQFYYDNDLTGVLGYELKESNILDYLRSVINKLIPGGKSKIFGVPLVSWQDEEESKFWKDCLQKIREEYKDQAEIGVQKSVEHYVFFTINKLDI